VPDNKTNFNCLDDIVDYKDDNEDLFLCQPSKKQMIAVWKLISFQN